jgi:sugar phosphate isomerase/epimerase
MADTISRRGMIAAGTAAVCSAATGTPLFAAATPASGSGASPRKAPMPGTTPIRLATRMTRTGRETPEETVKRIRDGGFTAVNSQPSQWNASELVELKAALKKYDVVVFEVGAYSNIIHPDTSAREKILAAIIRKFEDAESIGGSMVATVSGCCDPKYLINPHPDNWSAATWKVLVGSVRRILKDTSGMKTSLGMEAQITTNIDGPQTHRRLIDDVGDPRCAVNLDPTNMVTLDRYFHTAELLDECFDLLGESIHGCHAKDTFIEPDVQTLIIREVCPGRGVMDYPRYLAHMSRMKRPRALFPEHLPADQYAEANAYIRKTAEAAGVRVY